MNKEMLFKRWQALHTEMFNCEVEYDDMTAEVLLQLCTEVAEASGRAAVRATLDVALNTGDGSYKP